MDYSLNNKLESLGECKENSVVQLLTGLSLKLCENVLKDSPIKQKKLVNRLRSCAFETLIFKATSTDHKLEKNEYLEDDELIGSLVEVVYFNNLQNSTWTAKKNHSLSTIADKLSLLLKTSPQLKNMLVFLLHMSKSHDNTNDDDHSKMNQPFYENIFKIVVNDEIKATLPNSRVRPRSYKRYSPSMFDFDLSTKGSNPSLKNKSHSLDAPFEALPGSHLLLFEKYSTVWYAQNKNKCKNSVSATQKLNPLCIPELNLDVPRSLTVPSFRSSHLDEGYVTPDKEFIDNSSRRSSTSGFIDKKSSSLNVWNSMSVESLCKPLHYTWENLGEAVTELEPPFLAQTDVTVFECWKKYAMKRVGEELNDNSVERNIAINELFCDIKYLLIGIESRTFMYSEELKSFVMNPGTAIESLTSEAVSVYIEDVIECGNDVRLLSLLLRNSKQNINYNKQGLVFEAMCSSLSTWLQAYRGMVVKIEEESNILKLRSWLQPLRMQLRFIVNLCCPSSTRVLLDDYCPLPSGGELLTYIYNAAQMTAHSHISLVLYFFLEKCLKVYYRFIENWLFEGSCEDQYGEFFIESINNLGSPLDRSYWRRAFSLNYEKVPIFLTDLAEKIFICGKSLNLVKLCAPNDPLCKQLENSYPPLVPCLEESTLERLASDYHEFVTVCKPDCGINPLQSPRPTATAEEKADFLAHVKLQRDKSMSRVKAAQEEERMNIYQEKKKIFDIMKKEMEDAERRKIENRRKELAEDQQRLEELAQAALQDVARENEEKRRLIEYYKSISDLAEIRKLKAKWKAQRLHLHEKRSHFFADDKKNISNELLKQKIADEVDNRRKSCFFKLNITPDVEEGDKTEECKAVDIRSTIDSNRLEDGAEGLQATESESEDWGTTCVSVTQSCDTYVTAIDSKMSQIESETSSIEGKVSSTSIFEDRTLENTPVVSSTSLPEEVSPEEIDNRLKVDISEEQYDSTKLYELYNVAHSEAQKNKMKVLEFEFDLKCSRVENDKYYEKIDTSKTKVLEIKMSTNSEVIKERTLELELACTRAADARKEAAQNRARVMASEYDIIFHNEFEDRNAERRKHNIDPHNKMMSEEEDTVATPESNDDRTDIQDTVSDLKTLDDKSSPVKQSKCMSSQYFNGDGRFIFNSFPLLVDITERNLGTSEKPKVDVQKVDLSAIHNCLQKSVSIPTEIQHVFANDAVLRLFLNNEKLLDHLQCIRKYFFFLDGEYGRILTRSLFLELELAEHPSVLLSRHRLNAILQMATSSGSFHTCSPLIERLSFFVKEIPLAFLLTDPEVLNCLSMRYKLHWPLNIIISEDAILNYDRIFAFQLQLHRASWVLQQDFQTLKVKGMLKSSHYRQLQIFRHTMNQFIRTFTNYITTIALEGSWLEFKQSLVKVDTLDALYMAHVKYVKMVNFRCLLNKRSQPLQKQIYELLRAILTFHELLRNGEWVNDATEGNHTHSAFPRLSHQFSVFLRVARFLVKYLKQLVCKGYQPHFDLLLTYLCANDFYC